jgi:uncharacterized iron-regulated membrane protein
MGTAEIVALAFVAAFWIAAICCFIVWPNRRAQRGATGEPEREASRP